MHMSGHVPYNYSLRMFLCPPIVYILLVRKHFGNSLPPSSPPSGTTTTSAQLSHSSVETLLLAFGQSFPPPYSPENILTIPSYATSNTPLPGPARYNRAFNPLKQARRPSSWYSWRKNGSTQGRDTFVFTFVAMAVAPPPLLPPPPTISLPPPLPLPPSPPVTNPPPPSLRYPPPVRKPMASPAPATLLIHCKRVLHTSNGVLTTVATHPATRPVEKS